MLFNVDKSRFFESYKERNLYFKFFAGYYFNELVPGYQDRLTGFYALLRGDISEGVPALVCGTSFPLDALPVGRETHVSFDNHLAQLSNKDGIDRGEFADILVQDRHNQILIAIEVKFLSDWSMKKDIKGNANRLCLMKDMLRDQFGDMQVYQCLLITRAKMLRSANKIKRRDSQLKLLNEYSGQLIVLEWDRFKDKILGDVNAAPVLEFLNERLSLLEMK